MKPQSKKHIIKIKHPKRSPEYGDETMTVGQAWQKAKSKMKVQVGNNWHEFSYVGWESPSTKQKSGPYLVGVIGDQTVEINKDGKFIDAYPTAAEGYFPWIAFGRNV